MKVFVASLALFALVASAAAQLRNTCAGNPHGSHMNIGNPRDCQSFTMCLGSTAHPMTCAPGFHFSQQINDCDLEQRANCVPEPSDPEGPIDPNNPCSRNVNFELIASTASCSQYISCACGTANERACAEGLIWDARTQVCNVAARATCVSAPAVRPTCPRNPGNLPHPNDCKHFFLCLGQGSTPILRRCAPGMHFNRRLNECDRISCQVPALASVFGVQRSEDVGAEFVRHPRFGKVSAPVVQLPQVMQVQVEEEQALEEVDGLEEVEREIVEELAEIAA